MFAISEAAFSGEFGDVLKCSQIRVVAVGEGQLAQSRGIDQEKLLLRDE